MILITGATGFVGQQVVRCLAGRGLPLRFPLRAGSRDRSKLAGLGEIVETQDLFEEKADWWRTALAGVDTVVHLAWYAEPGKYLSAEVNLSCLRGTIELAQSCVRAGVRRFVGVGTCFEYDTDACILSVDTPLRPRTLYAACKVSAFEILSRLLPAAEVEFAWCRLFHLFGEGEDPRRLVPYLHEKLGSGQPAELTSGRQIRDFLPVEEAGAMIAELTLGSRQGPMNICSGVPTTVRQMAERIADEYGRRDLLRFGVREENAVDPPCVVGVRDEVDKATH